MTTEAVVNQIHCDGDINLSLYLPLDLLLAAASTLGALLLVLPYVNLYPSPALGYLLQHLVDLEILRVSLRILGRHKFDLVKARDLNECLKEL